MPGTLEPSTSLFILTRGRYFETRLIRARNTQTWTACDAFGLPDGLLAEEETSVIGKVLKVSGTPTVSGVFEVSLHAGIATGGADIAEIAEVPFAVIEPPREDTADPLQTVIYDMASATLRNAYTPDSPPLRLTIGDITDIAVQLNDRGSIRSLPYLNGIEIYLQPTDDVDAPGIRIDASPPELISTSNGPAYRVEVDLFEKRTELTEMLGALSTETAQGGQLYVQMRLQYHSSILAEPDEDPLYLSSEPVAIPVAFDPAESL